MIKTAPVGSSYTVLAHLRRVDIFWVDRQQTKTSNIDQQQEEKEREVFMNPIVSCLYLLIWMM